MEPLIKVEDLTISFRTGKEKIDAVKKVNFSVAKGETLCIVGESGCGKSITSLSLMGLLPENGEVSGGSIKFKEEELTEKSENQLRKYRGNELSMIFQDPMTALNPVFTIGYQMLEPLNIHTDLNKKDARKKAIDLLKQVGLSEPEKTLKKYPHELSGGMRQRVLIAISLACTPSLLIADEPTTALDVTIQAQILDLVEDLKEELNMGVIMVTHDMGVVAEVADRVMVMYAGEVVETGEVQEIFENPKHPYTEGLLASVPNVDAEDDELKSIPGTPPNISEEIKGCRFHPRCPYAMDICKQEEPAYMNISPSHQSKCWLQAKEATTNDREYENIRSYS